MSRDRIVVGIIDTSLSLKLQMDGALTVRKAIDMARQNEAVKKEQTFLEKQPFVQWEAAMLISCKAKGKAQESLTSTAKGRRKHGRKFKTVNKSHRGNAIKDIIASQRYATPRDNV